MPELPDLQNIVERLAPRLEGRRVTEATVREPIVLRVLLAGVGGFAAGVSGCPIGRLCRVGPFLRFPLGDRDMVVHCMLSGRLRLSGGSEKPLAYECFALHLDNGERLSYGDEKRMGKVYLTAVGSFDAIPGYLQQGVDVLSEAFSFERFEGLIGKRRHQARVFVMDQSALSAIGNAYADEILFSAGIHPKTPCSSLSPQERRRLYDSIRSVLRWGIEEVRKADRPLEEKVRDHMRVRGRKDQPCPVCGTTIRRTGVLGYDSFFCPKCQPAVRKQAIPW
jgi:formamidopyrimidine-DNA glycosylase